LSGGLTLSSTPDTAVSTFGCTKGVISDQFPNQNAAVNTLYLTGNASDEEVRYAMDGGALGVYSVEREGRSVYLGSGGVAEWGFRALGLMGAGEQRVYRVRLLGDGVQLLDGEARGLLMVVGL
jgi:hypothetical protein